MIGGSLQRHITTLTKLRTSGAPCHRPTSGDREINLWVDPRQPGGGRAYPARAGGPWLWSTLVLSLFQAVVVPSGFTTRVQPLAVDHDLVVVAAQEDAVREAGLAAVGLVPGVVHLAGARRAGCSRPAHWQCRSRSRTALRMWAGTVSLYPMSSGRLGPPSRAPSCWRRRKLASPPGPDSSSTALPMMACSSASCDRRARERTAVHRPPVHRPVVRPVVVRLLSPGPCRSLSSWAHSRIRSPNAAGFTSPTTTGVTGAPHAIPCAASPSSHSP